MKSLGFRSSLAFLLGSLALMSAAQEPSGPANLGTPRGEVATGAGIEANVKGAPSTRRLPRYFASVVDTKQRMAIYDIQSQYRERIEHLERQLAELRLAEMNEVEKVLTASQRARIEELRVGAATRTKEVPTVQGEALPSGEEATGGSPPKASRT